MVGVALDVQALERSGGVWVASQSSEAAFDAFARASGDRLLRTAYLLTGNWATAQDLVQSALTSTWTHWSRIREPAAAEAYARRCLARTSASWWRRKWTGEQPTSELPERASPHDAFAGAVDTSVAVLAALGRLDAKSRAVLVMRFFDDLSEADTATALGISPGTVKSRTSRALARLREMDVWEGMGR